MLCQVPPVWCGAAAGAPLLWLTGGGPATRRAFWRRRTPRGHTRDEGSVDRGSTPVRSKLGEPPPPESLRLPAWGVWGARSPKLSPPSSVLRDDHRLSPLAGCSATSHGRGGAGRR